MVLVTLIGEKLAIEGEEFTYLGANSECRNCQLKTVCFNLKPGQKYRITKLRDKYHKCNIHEGQTVVIEVEELPLIVAIPKNKDLIVGATTKVEKIECKNILCEFFEVCNNSSLQNEKIYTIRTISEKIQCPKRYELYKIEITE